MEEKEIIESVDYDRIKKVIPKYPEYVSKDFSEKIKRLNEEILSIEKELNSTRERAREIEKLLAQKEEQYNNLANIFTLEFETKSHEFIHIKSSIGITGLGNSIIGNSSMI